MEKKNYMINKKISSISHEFSMRRKTKLIGSNSLRGNLYSLDFDFVCDLNGTDEAIAVYFQKFFQSHDLTKKGILFLEFKCGVDKRLFIDEEDFLLEKYNKKMKHILPRPIKNFDEARDHFILRWSHDDVANGFIRLADGHKKSFVDCLKDDTIIKMDYAVVDGVNFIENSINYYKKSQNEISELETKKQLKDDFNEYYKKDTIKALKRLHSYLQLKDENKKQQKELEYLFNSSVGYCRKQISDLIYILEINQKFPKVIESIILNHVQRAKGNLANTSFIPQTYLKRLNDVNIHNYVKILTETIEGIQRIMNSIANDYYRSL